MFLYFYLILLIPYTFRIITYKVVLTYHSYLYSHLNFTKNIRQSDHLLEE